MKGFCSQVLSNSLRLRETLESLRLAHNASNTLDALEKDSSSDQLKQAVFIENTCCLAQITEGHSGTHSYIEQTGPAIRQVQDPQNSVFPRRGILEASHLTVKTSATQ